MVCDEGHQVLAGGAPLYSRIPMEPQPLMGLHVVLSVHLHRHLHRLCRLPPPLPPTRPPPPPLPYPLGPCPRPPQPRHGFDFRPHFRRDSLLSRSRDPRHAVVLAPL